jgi:hypothetical protein
MGTLAADGGSDCEQEYAHQTYTKSQLTASLTALYAHYNATVVYGMDPHRFDSGPGNTDHLGAGGFTLDSVAAYHGPVKKGDFISYLGPDRGDIPGVYHGLYDTSPDPNNTFYTPFYSRQYSRWPNGSVWTPSPGTASSPPSPSSTARSRSGPRAPRRVLDRPHADPRQFRADPDAVGAWAHLKGYQVRDDLSVGLGGSGAGELFAPSGQGILHWKQNAAKLWALDSSPLTPAATGKTQVSFARNGDGRPEIFYADPDNPTVATQWTQGNGTWTRSPGLLGGSPPMLESVAAATAGDGRISIAIRNSGGRISIAIRNSGGGVSMVSQTAPNVGFAGSWPDLGNVIVGAPALAVDADGRLVVLAMELDGALHVDRQTAVGTESPFGDWQLAGA